MKVHLPLDEILRGKGVLHVLRVLCRRPETPLSAPELARTSGIALSQTQAALALLESQGMVDRSVAGRSHLWTIRQGNALFPPLQALLEVERGLEDSLMEDLSRGLQPVPLHRATLFGSVARAEERGWSDVDLLVELEKQGDREKAWDALVPLSALIRDRFGLNLAPIVVTRSERSRVLSPGFRDSVADVGRVVKEAP
jgi:predicted nucleotidyltransferase